MKIAVLNEVSASNKNSDIVAAIESCGQEVLNLGMHNPEEKPSLLYTHTGLMAALTINMKIADFVVGGCGTGQGFLTSVMQYPGIICGHIPEPLDAWLFAQINGGNCISLPLNQGYGWAGDVNLRFLFERLFGVEFGGGYPEHRKEPQKAARIMLNRISEATHRPLVEILPELPEELVSEVLLYPRMREAIEESTGGEKELRGFIESYYSENG